MFKGLWATRPNLMILLWSFSFGILTRLFVAGVIVTDAAFRVPGRDSGCAMAGRLSRGHRPDDGELKVAIDGDDVEHFTNFLKQLGSRLFHANLGAHLTNDAIGLYS